MRERERKRERGKKIGSKRGTPSERERKKACVPVRESARKRERQGS